MNTQKEMKKAIKHAGKYMQKEQDRVLSSRVRVTCFRRHKPVRNLPIEYCPECLSLKRKPNKECVNHESYWISADMQKLYDEPWRKELPNAIDKLSEIMVKTIANKLIVVQDTYDGRIAQRYWYKVAQKMLKKLMKEYERVCKEMYK